MPKKIEKNVDEYFVLYKGAGWRIISVDKSEKLSSCTKFYKLSYHQVNRFQNLWLMKLVI